MTQYTKEEIKQFEGRFWNTKLHNLKKAAKDAKAVMFGEDIEVLFEMYRVSEGTAELNRRVELAKPANQEDFETVINYISNYFDLDSVELSMSESVFNWIDREDLESYFTDTVLPTMIASPNSYLSMLPQEVNGLLDMKLTLIDFNQVIYEDNNQLIYRTDTDEDNLAYYVKGNQSKSNIIVLNREGGYLYDSNMELLSEINFEVPTTNKYWFKLGGLKVMGQQGFYQSYFKGSIDKSIIATRIFSDMELLRMRLANPITIMKKLPCTSCEGGDKSCGSCHGSGQVELKPSIASVFYFNEFDLSGSNKTSLDDIIKYIQPPVTSVDLQMKHYEYHSNEVKEGLNNFYYKHSQSGVAKEVDREDKVASTEVILYRLFGLASDILNSYSNIVTIDKQEVSVVVPNELVTDGAIPKAIDGYSAGELAERLLAYYKNKYKDDAVSLKLYTYAVQNDFLFPYTAEEKKVLGTPSQINYSNQLPLAIMRVKSKYADRVRLSTDLTIKKWLDAYILTEETI